MGPTMDANASARLGERMAHLEGRFESAEGRLLQLDAKLDATAKSLDAKIDATAKSLDAKIDATAKSLDAKIDATAKGLDAKIEAVARDLSARLDATSNRTLSFIVGSWLTVMLALFFHR